MEFFLLRWKFGKFRHNSVTPKKLFFYFFSQVGPTVTGFLVQNEGFPVAASVIASFAALMGMAGACEMCGKMCANGGYEKLK